ncbi:MAG: hypothetical protein PHU43_02910 [Candidatus Bipolaricaulis sp.]|nr:hypothetical protein [Candidatus Bipolaricaulis sp.]
MARKTWREKLENDKGLPRVEEIGARMSARWGEGTFVIRTPREVDAPMHAVPEGSLTTINALREVLAARHGATIAYPITTGIFARVAAEAAGEVDITRIGERSRPAANSTPSTPVESRDSESASRPKATRSSSAGSARSAPTTRSGSLA